jgi:3'-5' exoribonuclease
VVRGTKRRPGRHRSLPGDQARLHLLHLITSHHGEYQCDTPHLPKTPEAMVLHHVDYIDAKLEMFRRGYQSSRELGHGIFERFRPWPVNIIAPLPAVALVKKELPASP